MDPEQSIKIKDLSTETVSFKDLASLLKLGVEELNRRASWALERMPEIKAAWQIEAEKTEYPGAPPGVQKLSRTIAKGLYNTAGIMSTGVFDAVKISTAAVIKAREIFGSKKK